MASCAALVAALTLLLLLLAAAPCSAANRVFQVRRKFPVGGGSGGSNITALRAHDGHCHCRLLGATNLSLGSIGLPTDTRLYCTEIKLGTPPKRYYVQIDTARQRRAPGTEGMLRAPRGGFARRSRSTAGRCCCPRPFWCVEKGGCRCSSPGRHGGSRVGSGASPCCLCNCAEEAVLQRMVMVQWRSAAIMIQRQV